jgi:hypothetical protein
MAGTERVIGIIVDGGKKGYTYHIAAGSVQAFNPAARGRILGFRETIGIVEVALLAATIESETSASITGTRRWTSSANLPASINPAVLIRAARSIYPI